MRRWTDESDRASSLIEAAHLAASRAQAAACRTVAYARGDGRGLEFGEERVVDQLAQDTSSDLDAYSRLRPAVAA
jgi:hypothetical protein